MEKHRSFYKLLRYLRENLDLPPFSVRRMTLPNDLHGDCATRNGRFYIRVNKSLSPAQAIDTLVHEIAHIPAWDKQLDDHGTVWGKHYSLVYRKFLEWNELQNL